MRIDMDKYKLVTWDLSQYEYDSWSIIDPRLWLNIWPKNLTQYLTHYMTQYLTQNWDYILGLTKEDLLDAAHLHAWSWPLDDGSLMHDDDVSLIESQSN